MVPPSIVCDVGADHGKLIISLVEEGIASFGYAIENKKGPFDNLKKNVSLSPFSNKITCLFSDGIKDLPSDVSTLILAGMGGSTIVSILKKDILKLINVKTIIVDAHSELPLVREEISRLGFTIADEKMIFEDNIYYEIIKFIRADIAYLDNLDKIFGPKLRKEKSLTFKNKYMSRLNDIEKILNMPNLSDIRIKELKNEIDLIRSVLW